MRWGKAMKRPVGGELREVRKFALLPMDMSDGTWVWLEHYVVTEVYSASYDRWFPHIRRVA